MKLADAWRAGNAEKRSSSEVEFGLIERTSGVVVIYSRDRKGSGYEVLGEPGAVAPVDVCDDISDVIDLLNAFWNGVAQSDQWEVAKKVWMPASQAVTEGMPHTTDDPDVALRKAQERVNGWARRQGRG